MKYMILMLMLSTSICLSAQFPRPNSKLKLSEAFSKSKTYGAYCGIAGQHPPSRIAVEDLIANKDLITLRSWLNSPNLVIQTYAAEACIRLANNGSELNARDVDLVLNIKEKEEAISTCTGCVYEELTIKECLNDFEFNTL